MLCDDVVEEIVVDFVVEVDCLGWCFVFGCFVDVVCGCVVVVVDCWCGC